MKVTRVGRTLVLEGRVDELAWAIHLLFTEHDALESEGKNGKRGPGTPVVVTFETQGCARRAARALEDV